MTVSPFFDGLPVKEPEPQRPQKPETVPELVKLGHPLIRTVLDEFDFSNPPTDPIALAKVLAESMLWYDGLGLSANQIGLPYRAFAMKSNPVIVCYNPEIIDRSEKMDVAEEGCLTFPGIVGKVKRHLAIRVRYIEPNGEVKTRTLNGLSARIFQHEMDHMNGLIFTDHMTKLNLEMLIKKAKKRKIGYSIHQFGGKPRIIEVKKAPPRFAMGETFDPWVFKGAKK